MCKNCKYFGPECESGLYDTCQRNLYIPVYRDYPDSNCPDFLSKESPKSKKPLISCELNFMAYEEDELYE